MKKSVGDILTAQENITGNAVSGLLVSPVVDDNFLHGEFAENNKKITRSSILYETPDKGWLLVKLVLGATLLYQIWTSIPPRGK